MKMTKLRQKIKLNCKIRKGMYMRSNEIQMTVEFGNTDAAGIVFYPNYFMWFDKGTHWLFKSMQLAPKELLS